MRISDWSSDVCSSDLAYEPLPGQHVKGKLTLGENIADLAGLTVAYDAYKLALEGKEAPFIDGFTGDQRFYLGWAQVWRRNYRQANLSRRLLTDPPSPSIQRRSEEHTSELQTLMRILYGVFRMKKKKNETTKHTILSNLNLDKSYRQKRMY